MYWLLTWAVLQVASNTILDVLCIDYLPGNCQYKIISSPINMDLFSTSDGVVFSGWRFDCECH